MALATRDIILIAVAGTLFTLFIVFIGLWFGYPPFNHGVRRLFKMETSGVEQTGSIGSIATTGGHNLYTINEENSETLRVRPMEERLPSGRSLGSGFMTASAAQTSDFDTAFNSKMGIY